MFTCAIDMVSISPALAILPPRRLNKSNVNWHCRRCYFQNSHFASTDEKGI